MRNICCSNGDVDKTPTHPELFCRYRISQQSFLEDPHAYYRIALQVLKNS